MIFESALIGHIIVNLVLPEQLLNFEIFWLNWFFEVEEFVDDSVLKYSKWKTLIQISKTQDFQSVVR